MHQSQAAIGRSSLRLWCWWDLNFIHQLFKPNSSLLSNKFMKQVQSAVEIAKFKCSQATGLHSFGYLIRCHAASVANDSLNANRISFGVQQPPFLYSALILGNQSSNWFCSPRHLQSIYGI